MIDTVARHILALHGLVALAVVFVVPLLESSAFVGFVFPGEIAVLLGGVLAYQHRVSHVRRPVHRRPAGPDPGLAGMAPMPYRTFVAYSSLVARTPGHPAAADLTVRIVPEGDHPAGPQAAKQPVAAGLYESCPTP